MSRQQQLESRDCLVDKAAKRSPKASIASKERPTLAVVAMEPERRGAFGGAPAPLLEAMFATGGRGGSITSLVSRGGFGALAGGCASLAATESRAPASAVAGNSVTTPSTPFPAMNVASSTVGSEK